MAHRANQPSNTTLRLFNGEVADETNPCIAMIMGNAFQKNQTLIYDQILRRDEKSEGLQKYPQDIIQSHETFVQSVRESSEAKVEIVHGALVRERIFQQQSSNFDILPLWGEFKGVSIVLDHESNYKNADRGNTYRRIIVFVAHPQRIFYASPEENTTQEKLTTVAAKIAKTKFVKGYYTDRKWKEVVPSDFTNRVKRKFFDVGSSESSSEILGSNCSNSDGSLSLATYNSKVAEPSTTQEPIGEWDLYLGDRAPSSITESRNTVALALTEMHSSLDLHNWESPVDFPAIIQKWLGSQRGALFKNVPLESIADIMAVYDQISATTKSSLYGEPSLSDMILALIEYHAAFLKRLPNSVIDDLVYCSVKPDEVVEVTCKNCQQSLGSDTLVRWSINRTGHYVVRHKRCKSPMCQGKLRFAVPKDLDIPYTASDRSSLLLTIARKSHESWRDSLVQPGESTQALPSVVASWCIHCEENTRLKDGRASYEDRSPRWVLGTPSKYVERRPKCLTCQVKGRSGTGRFIPTDASIPSIHGRKLWIFDKRWGSLRDGVKAEILGCESKGTRKPRLQKANPRLSKKMRLA